MATDDRLQAYLALGEDLCGRTAQLVGEVTPRLVANPEILSFRDRVLIGLALKIDSSFRSLIVDARAHRLEAMHHLKTLVEAFIYFHVVAKDLTDNTAALVLAHAFDKTATRLRLIAAPPEDRQHYEELRDGLGGRPDLPQLEQLAKDHGLDSWYQSVYRLACEPAHIADLVAFMPDPDQPVLTIGGDGGSGAEAATAMHYAIPIVLDLIRVLNDGNKLGLFVDVSMFQARYDGIGGKTA
jgi:Family of unknown function (DUF5677)